MIRTTFREFATNASNGPRAEGRAGDATNDRPGLAARPVVLFVDDEPVLLESLGRCLRRAPFECLFAHSGAEALAQLARTHVDVLVSDERMPGMSGTELLERVRERFPDVVRILLTGGASLADAARVIGGSGVYRFLDKPIANGDLVRTIESGLAMKKVLSTTSRLRGELERTLPARATGTR
jgi:DNA-binding NtrC family response regulator